MTQFSRMTKHSIALMVAATIPMSGIHVFAGDGGLGGGVPGIAEREIARRMARIEDARQAMEKGDELFAQGDHEGALAQYRAAKEIFDQLPNAPFIQDWRDLANLKFADCAVTVAREKAAKGDYVAARKLLDEAVLAVPGHKKALLFAAQLDDPDRWPPALTPEHVENVGKVGKGLLLAASSVEIGNYDKALEEYEDVLRIDPYNTAARRGMELAERKRADYFDSARDHQRIRMLNIVNEAWEHKPAVKGFQVENTLGGGKAPTVYLSQKMQKIVFPQVQFSGASIEEAVEFLRVKSRDLDTFETDPARKGVNIILKPGENAPTASISLDLKDVPMQEALRYVTELAGMKYKVEPFAVLIVPVTETTTEQFTRIYKVPPDFESMSSGGGDAAAPAAPADPFAAGGGAAATATGLTKRQSALEILKGQGILFPEGATAVFNKVTSQLIVKNTQPNLDLVEAFVDSIINQITKQVYITTKFVEVTQKNTDELGFDWLLGGFGTNSDGVVIGGGSDGNWGGNVSYTGTLADLVTNGAVAPVTRGLRTGSRAIRGDSVDSLFSTTAAGSDTVAPGVLSVAGIFTDPQFGMVIRALSQRKGVDLMSAPSVTTKGGQQATVEVVREFIYPTEFDPPQIPTNVGSTVGGVGGGGSSAIPVTPTTPTAFEMRPVGVRMEVDPVIGENGSIDLNLLPEVTEFDGFINYGSPIFSVTPRSAITDIFGNILGFNEESRLELTPNIINQPIFSSRKVKTSVTVWDGQTVALGGLIREDVQDVEDKLPVLGDIPILGRLFRSEVEDHFKRNLMIFVTAVLIDPAGQRIKAQGSGSSIPDDQTANPMLLPAVGN